MTDPEDQALQNLQDLARNTDIDLRYQYNLPGSDMSTQDVAETVPFKTGSSGVDPDPDLIGNLFPELE